MVIVGGGFAGACVAQALEPDFRVTLIDNKDYFEFTPSVLRTIVEPNHGAGHTTNAHRLDLMVVRHSQPNPGQTSRVS